jgi:hypothetical protein
LFIQQTILALNNRELFHSNVVLAKQADAQVHSAHGLLSSRMRELHPRIKFRRYELTRTSEYLGQIIKESQDA